MVPFYRVGNLQGSQTVHEDKRKMEFKQDEFSSSGFGSNVTMLRCSHDNVKVEVKLMLTFVD